MGIGDWGLGIGDWGFGPILNLQSSITKPQKPFIKIIQKKKLKKIFLKMNKI